jgi:Cys-tRNA(Pro) deacylase
MAGRPAAVDRVEAAARALGLDVEIREFPDGTRTAEEAAAAIGVEVGQIVKSLIFSVDGQVTLALVAGKNRLREKSLAAAAGGSKVERVDADAVRAATSYAIGGVPPFGYPAPLPTYVDPDLLAYDVVWAAAGSHNHVFAIAPDDLVRATNAVVADLAQQ